MTLAILRKDWGLLWPMVVLVTAIQLCWQWSQYTYGLFGVPGDIDRALSALSLAWLGAAAALAAAVVQTDAPPSVDQDWLIRPIPRSSLLLAKLLFVALSVVLPTVLLDWGRAILLGFAPGAALGATALKAVLLYIYLLVPVIALAATVVRMTDLLVLGAALVVIYGLTRSLGSALLGPEACPTCGTGIAWIQHLWQHLEILGGSLAILAIQYSRRTPHLSRMIALAGTVVLVLAQLPWGAAFAVQQLGASRAAGSAVRLTVSSAVDLTQGYASGTHASIPIGLSLHVEGLSANELLFVNRSQINAWDGAGQRLYRQVDTGTLALFGHATAVQTVNVSATAYQVMARHSAQRQLRQWLTLMVVTARLSLPARDGERRSAHVGRCASRLNSDGSEINVRCQRLGAAPICVSATLYGAGRHNPAVLQCEPDYRPYMPVTEILSAFGADVPIRDPSGAVRYAVDPAQIDRSVLELSFYETRAHFTRLVNVPAPTGALADRVAQ